LDDLKAVGWQLQREINAEFEVIKRCSLGYPLGILNQPLPGGIGGPVFSTPWWLTCPQLRKDIHLLEAEHALDRMFSPELKNIYREYRKKAARKRSELIPRELLEEMYQKKPDLYREMVSRGVAGESGPGLKCLHAHYAFFLLYPDYPLGQEIGQLLPGDPEERCGRYCEKTCSCS